MQVDFKVKRAENCALIDTKKWITDGTGITFHRMSGRDIPTFINKVLSVHPVTIQLKEVVKEGDTVLLSKIASDISQYKKFPIHVGDERYFNCPVMQILGVFKDEEITLESLNMCTDKILIKKIGIDYKGLKLGEDNTMIGEVIKIGTNKFDKDWRKLPLSVKVGDVVLVRDNVTTKVRLKEGEYYATEDSMIVGRFDSSDFNLENLTILNNYILMSPYISETLGDVLLTPLLDYENEDITEIYNRDLFRVVKVDSKVDRVLENDILLVDRNFTNYVYVGTSKYFVISGIDYITSKVKK